jgi:hypothetical protein
LWLAHVLYYRRGHPKCCQIFSDFHFFGTHTGHEIYDFMFCKVPKISTSLRHFSLLVTAVCNIDIIISETTEQPVFQLGNKCYLVPFWCRRRIFRLNCWKGSFWTFMSILDLVELLGRSDLGLKRLNDLSYFLTIMIIFIS